MDEDTINLCLKTIEELVLDEEKLVTYIYLSKKLCIHVNDSKSLLQTFVKNFRTKKPNMEMNVSYLVSGLYEDNKGCTTVCSEKNIQDLKGSLITVFFEHIYSVSRGSPKIDSLSFSAINKFADLPLCLGLIKNKMCIKHSQTEIGYLRSNSYESSLNKLQQKPQVNGQTNKNPKQEPIEIDVKHNEESSLENIKIESTNIIKTMSTSPKNKPVPSSTVKNVNKQLKGIAGFFMQNGQVKKEAKIADSINKDVSLKEKVKPVQVLNNKTKPNNEMNHHNTSASDKNLTNGKQSKQSNDKETKKPITKNKYTSKSTNNIKKNAKVDKKRKRLLHVSDSESDKGEDDPFVDNEENTEDFINSDDEIPPTPTVNTVKVTSGIINPKKKRKIIDKTYTDDEGYCLTKKVEIYESCSDNEDIPVEKPKIIEIVPTKKDVLSNKKDNNENKKSKPPQKGKQVTMMNFFKRTT